VSDFLIFLTRTADDRWVYTTANRAFAATLERVGLSVDVTGLMGKEAAEVEAGVLRLDPATCDWFREARQRAARSLRPTTAERALELPGGTFVGEFTFIPVAEADGRCRHMLVDGRDVTALRRAEGQERAARDQLLQSQKLEALGTLAGGIAHDFNNVLTGILGFAELGGQAADLPAARRVCEQILQAAERSRELVARILTFARQRPPDRHTMVLADVVREVLPLLRASFPKAVEIVEDLPAVGPQVLADGGQLHQVILNLCTNAVHAMPGGGRMRVGVEVVELVDPIPADLCPLAAGPHAVLTVADSGTGMSADTLRRLFEPFYTTKPAGRGTGLGLSIVHGIVRDHLGAVRVRSELGRGSAFDIHLPVAAGPRTPVPQAIPLPPPRGERVLCLDDDPTLADVACQMLTGLGYRATAFPDPLVAFAAFAADPDAFQAVLTDNRMPGWTGVEFIRRVTALRPGLPVVLVSGVFDPEDLETVQSVRHGATLAKPYTADQLARAIRQVLAPDR
jgi:signal transduction histidine kinase/CheY-like chemotaxis protein